MVPDGGDYSWEQLLAVLGRLRRIGLVRGWMWQIGGALCIAVRVEALCARAEASSALLEQDAASWRDTSAQALATRGWCFWWPHLRAALDVVDEEEVGEEEEHAEAHAIAAQATCGAEQPWPLLETSEALQTLTGYAAYESVGRSLAMLLGASDWAVLVHSMARLGWRDAAHAAREVHLVRKDGSKVRALLALSLVKGDTQPGGEAPVNKVCVCFTPVTDAGARL